MSLGLYDRQQRQRRRMLWALVRWGIGLAVVAAAGLFAYQTGTTLAELDVGRLSGEVAALSGRIESLESENAGLKSTAGSAAQRAAEWEQRYRAEVPTGAAKQIFDLAQQKLAEGVEPGRLAFVIGAAGNPRVCDAEPESKRFIVRTPVARAGKDSSVAFAERTITVTADGAPALNECGQKEGWFDLAQPVTVQFAELGGKTSEARGVLPLQHALVIGDSEWRFAIAADDKRGFAVVTGERCNFP